MKITKNILMYLLVLCPAFVLASYKDTNNVKVEIISVWTTSSGDVLVQTNPRHSMAGLTCTDNYWLVLYKNHPGFETTLSMLLTAQTAKLNINISAEDNSGNAFCRVRRVITHAN